MVQQVAGLKARVAGGVDPLAPQQLVNLLVSLTGCLSLLREGLHGELLGQVLGVSLWACPQVRFCAESKCCPDRVVSSPLPLHNRGIPD